MALIICPECKKRISETAETCPKCGLKLSRDEVDKIKMKAKDLKNKVLIGTLAVFALLALFGIFSSDKKITVPSVPLSVSDNVSVKYSSPQEQQESQAAQAITGVEKYRLYSYSQADKGSEYIYNGKERFKISFFFAQTEITLRYNNKSLDDEFGVGYMKFLEHNFKVGYDKEGFSKPTNRYLVAQSDLDGDMVDELIIAVFDNNVVYSIAGVSINVYKQLGHSVKLIGVLTADNILGNPVIRIYKNKITVLRNLHGFYYQLTLEHGRVIDTSYI